MIFKSYLRFSINVFWKQQVKFQKILVSVKTHEDKEGLYELDS